MHFNLSYKDNISNILTSYPWRLNQGSLSLIFAFYIGMLRTYVIHQISVNYEKNTLFSEITVGK